MKNKKILFTILKYVLLFLFLLGVLLLFGANNTDNVWNYGVAHAIRMGELPYRDYNSITTPLYQFLMSSFLWIYDSYLTYLVEQALLCCLLFYLLEKMIGKNVWILCSILLFPIYYILFPNYNFITLFFFLLLMYLEEKKEKDSLIGFILGLLILSKHSVGGITFIFSLLACKSFKKAGKRLLFALIPLGCFLFYLLISHTFFDFMNLCVFGLFDFADSNHYLSIFFLSLTLLCFLYTIYSFWKKKDSINYYLIPAFSFLIPIVDMFHSVYFLAIFLIIIFWREPISKIKIPVLLGIVITGMTFLCNVVYGTNLSSLTYSSNGRMKYVLLDQGSHDYIQTILDKYQSYDSSYMLSLNSMYFDIESGHSITYFDIPLYGNFGYHGIENMKKKIDSMHHVYFFVADHSNRQYANVLNDYVRENGSFVDMVEDMEIYYLE